MSHQTRESPPDSFEEPLQAAAALMRERKVEEACRLLAQAEELALSKQETDDAALFSSVQGSYLSAVGRDSEALDAYRKAERHSKGDAHFRLTTARHLVFGLGQPDRSLEIVNEILDSPNNSPAVYQSARAIRGHALLAQRRTREAITELQAISREFSNARLPSLSCNLTLVEEIARQRLAPEHCRQYLEMLEAKAKEENQGRVLAKVLEIKALLSAS